MYFNSTFVNRNSQFSNFTSHMLRLSILLLSFPYLSFSQGKIVHPNAHAHNDYEHVRPLKDALLNGFISVEADVHLQNKLLLVAHNRPGSTTETLEKLYLAPLDSLLKTSGGRIYPGYDKTFYLMIDCKTEASSTYEAIRAVVTKYPRLRCAAGNCPVMIFLSGNRPLTQIMSESYSGIGLDGRPADLGNGYSSERMPVISDHYMNWSRWDGKSKFLEEDLQRLKDLAQRVHGEGKKLRLWAIPDNELTWEALLNVGVDFINTDHLEELNRFLTRKGL